MKQISAEKLLRAIERNAFKGIDLKAIVAKAVREERLEQIERMLAENSYGRTALWLSDQFWTADRELILIEEPHPLLLEGTTLRDQQATGLSDEDYAEAEWLMQTAWMCHSLYRHMPFDLNLIADGLTYSDDLDANWRYQNKALVTWIRETRHRHVAAWLMQVMLDVEFAYARANDLAVNDYYALNCDDSFFDIQNAEQCEMLISKCFEAMEEMEQHHQQGLDMGLTVEQIRVCNALWEYVPHNYTNDIVGCSREFCAEAAKLLPKEPYIKSDKGASAYIRKAFKHLHPIADRWQLEFDEKNPANLEAAYLQAWLYSKYFGEYK